MRFRRTVCCFLTALLTVSSLNMSVLAAENVLDNAVVQDADSAVITDDTVTDTNDDTSVINDVTAAADADVAAGEAIKTADTETKEPETADETEALVTSSGDGEYQTVDIEYEGRIDDGALPDNDELFAGYVDRVFDTGSDEPLVRSSAGSRLTGADANLYNQLIDKVTSVANGQLADTIFVIPAASVYPKTSYTHAELGSSLDNSSVNNALKNKKVYPDISKVVTALTYDCPYALYWFDKTTNYYFQTPYSYDQTNVTLGDVTVKMSPLADYAGNSQYKVNTSKTSAARNAAANAASIVSGVATLSDYNKLAAYRDFICDSVEYNTVAQNNGGYGDPWQLIYVFDNDPSTDVVCEGYSKAFKYLCDITDFASDEIECICVQGWGGSNGGTMEAHMWNVVHMDDGNNYHVDVTWYDSGWVNLFLAGMTQHQLYQGTYHQIYQRNAYNVADYVLDEQTKSMFSDDRLSVVVGDSYQPGDTTWQEKFSYSIEDSEIRLKRFIASDADITIPSTAVISGNRYKTVIDYKINTNFFATPSKVKSFTVLKGVSASGDMSSFFKDLNNLTTVDLRGLDAENVTGMKQFFSGCSSLTTVYLDGINTSKVQDMSYMFNGCESLVNLNVTDLDTPMVKDMNRMFLSCSKLNGLNLKNFNTASCTDMTKMFAGCLALTTLDISSFDTSGVLGMSEMFRDCVGLTSINLGDMNTGKVKEAYGMFSNCNQLPSITLPASFVTTNMTQVYAMFGECASLTSLDLSKWDLRNVKNEDSAYIMLGGCVSLKQISVPTHLSVKVDLPQKMYDDDGNSYEELPKDLSESKSLSTTPVAPKLNGLCESPDGKTCLYKDGVLQSSVTGMYEAPNVGWVKLVNGVMDKGYNDLYQSLELGTVMIKNGVWDSTYTDMFNSNVKGGWAKVKDGKFDGFYSDLYESPSLGWIKVYNGMMDTGYNDLYNSPIYGWWKINNGAVDFAFTDLFNSPSYGWWLINAGSVAFGYNDLFGSPAYGWWKVTGGSVDFGYTDLYESPTLGIWVINGGSVDFGYNAEYDSPTLGKWKVEGGHATEKAGSQSEVKIPDGLRLADDGVWYLYKDGKVAEGFTDLYCDAVLGWWKIKNGVVDFGYSDLYDSPSYGMWVVSGGSVNFGYNGKYDSKTFGSYNVEGGYAISKVSEVVMPDGLAPAADGNWYLYLNGKIAEDFNDLYCDATYGWWKIKNGVVDFGYNDLYCSTVYGWWKVKGGTVDFGYNDLYCSDQYGWWLVLGGSVAFGYDDLFGSPVYGWWKVKGGMVDFGYTDLYCSSSCGWWLVSGGTVAFDFNDIFASLQYGDWKISGGSVDFGYTGDYNSKTYGYYRIQNGQVIPEWWDLEDAIDDLVYPGSYAEYSTIKVKVLDSYETKTLSTSFGYSTTAPRGSKFIVVKMQVENITDSAFDTDLDFRMIDDQGRGYEWDTDDVWFLENTIYFPTLEPGVPIETNIIYLVPDDTRNALLCGANAETDELIGMKIK